MGTTSGSLAAAVIDALSSRRTNFAVLHRAEDLRAGTVASDVDLVVADRPIEVVEDLQGALDSLDLKPVMVWRYDSGETLTVFFARPDLSAGLQFDLLRDRRGQGKYGIRTEVLLEATQQHEWPQLQPLLEILYLLRKRLLKGQGERVRRLVEDLNAFPAVLPSSRQ